MHIKHILHRCYHSRNVSSRIALSCRKNIVCTCGLNEHTFPSDSTAQLVERRTSVPEGVTSNPARVNSFSVDISSVRES